MNQEVKDQWINALESGQYNQICGNFSAHHIPKGRCALGVLRDLLPERRGPLLATSGLTEEQWSKIIMLNDVERLTFPEIAIWIKENL